MSFTGDGQCAESTVPTSAKSWICAWREFNQCHANQMYCHCGIKFEQIRSDRPPFVSRGALVINWGIPRERRKCVQVSPGKEKQALVLLSVWEKISETLYPHYADFIKPVISSKPLSNWERPVPMGDLFAAKTYFINKCKRYLISDSLLLI